MDGWVADLSQCGISRLESVDLGARSSSGSELQVDVCCKLMLSCSALRCGMWKIS